MKGITQFAGCSKGVVVKSTQCVMIAFMPLHDQAICWPNAEEKHEALDWVESVSCHAWQPGFCMVDGTLVPLSSKPGHYGEQFFDQKQNYSLSLTVCSKIDPPIFTDTSPSACHFTKSLHH